MKIGLALFLVIVLYPFSGLSAPVEVIDLAGRRVTVNVPVSRVILADSRMLLPMSLLHPGDALKGIVAWDDSLKTRAPDMGRYFARQFPNLNN